METLQENLSDYELSNEKHKDVVNKKPMSSNEAKKFLASLINDFFTNPTDTKKKPISSLTFFTQTGSHPYPSGLPDSPFYEGSKVFEYSKVKIDIKDIASQCYQFINQLFEDVKELSRQSQISYTSDVRDEYKKLKDKMFTIQDSTDIKAFVNFINDNKIDPILIEGKIPTKESIREYIEEKASGYIENEIKSTSNPSIFSLIDQIQSFVSLPSKTIEELVKIAGEKLAETVVNYIQSTSIDEISSIFNTLTQLADRSIADPASVAKIKEIVAQYNNASGARDLMDKEAFENITTKAKQEIDQALQTLFMR